MTRVAIDPVTRLNGALRLEVDVRGGAVTDAWTAATTFRGIEAILRGRDPREAWLMASRICGSCTGVHGLASVRAVEHAFGIRIPANARLLRNLLASTGLVRDHVRTFYQAQLPDWVDVPVALRADPAATARLGRSLSAWPTSTTASLAAVQARLRTVLASAHPGPLATPWSGHPAFALTPEQSLLLLAHALEAMDWQRDVMRIHALLGGKDPHPQTYLVGGMALAPPWGGPAPAGTRGHPDVPDRNAPNPLGDDGLTLLDEWIGVVGRFVEQVFLPDVRMLVGAYPAWTSIGAGSGNYLAWGDLPESDDRDGPTWLPAGRLTAANPSVIQPVDPADVRESVAHAWYADDAAPGGLRSPVEGVTVPAFDATLPLASLAVDGRHSWVKAPRYGEEPMETGPLARVLVADAQGHRALTTPLGALLTTMELDAEALPSVAGRLIARAVEASAAAKRVDSWLWELRTNLATGDVAVVDLSSWDPASWPDEAEGCSTGEGPRGAVAHWVRIRDRVVDHYQVVDGSTWNASSRDAAGRRGPLDAALLGTPIADPTRPLEVLRVVHSLNPCPACAVHAFDLGGISLREGVR